MTRDQLAHVLRAAAKIADNEDILVIGSQAILGSFSEDELPEVAWVSVEADIAFLDPENGELMADLVDGAIGELSGFHALNNYYAQGVDASTAKLPDGWRERLVPFHPSSAEPAKALCLEPHDLAISKLVAMREKDTEFVMALLRAGLVRTEVLMTRVDQLSCVAPNTRRAIGAWIRAAGDRLARRA